MNLYVSPTGNDTWRGALLKANADKSDGPLATPAGAVRRLRALKEKRVAWTDQLPFCCGAEPTGSPDR